MESNTSYQQRHNNVLLVIGLITGIGWYTYRAINSGLFIQPLWTVDAAKQFSAFFICFIMLMGTGALIFFRRLKILFFLAFSASIILAFGFGATSACLFILVSSYCAGKIVLKLVDCRFSNEGLLETLATLTTGMAIEMGITQVLGRFPINYPALYLILLFIPVIIYYFHATRLTRQFTLWLSTESSPISIGTVAAVFLLMFIVCWHMVYASNPDRGGDALCCHLLQSFSFAHKHVFEGDFKHNSLSLMPLGGEALYGLAYMFGDELAARLINFCCYLITVAFLYAFLRQRIQLFYAILLCCIFVSIPVGLLETSSNFIDNPQQLFFAAAFMALVSAMQSSDNKLNWISLATVSVFATISVKVMGVFYAAPMGVLIGYYYYKERKRLSVKHILLLTGCGLLFAFPYFYSYWESGNPVLPFLNGIFHSKYFFADANFHDTRWPVGFSIRNLYLLNFTGKCLESNAGAIGSQFVVFFTAAVLMMCARKDPIIFTAFFVAFAFVFIMMSSLVYTRYLYPIFPVILIVLSVIYFRAENYAPLARKLLNFTTLAVIAINIYLLPSAGWALHQPNAISLVDLSQKELPPELKVNNVINMLAGDKSLVVYAYTIDAVDNLWGKPFASNWRNFDASHYFTTVGDYSPEFYERLLTAYNANFFVLRDNDNAVIHYLDSHPEKYKHLATIEHVTLYSVSSAIANENRP